MTKLKIWIKLFKYYKKNENKKKVWSDKIMVNCDVICVRTNKIGGVLSLPRVKLKLENSTRSQSNMHNFSSSV